MAHFAQTLVRPASPGKALPLTPIGPLQAAVPSRRSHQRRGRRQRDLLVAEAVGVVLLDEVLQLLVVERLLLDHHLRHLVDQLAVGRQDGLAVRVRLRDEELDLLVDDLLLRGARRGLGPPACCSAISHATGASLSFE